MEIIQLFLFLFLLVGFLVKYISPLLQKRFSFAFFIEIKLERLRILLKLFLKFSSVYLKLFISILRYYEINQAENRILAQNVKVSAVILYHV